MRRCRRQFALANQTTDTCRLSEKGAQAPNPPPSTTVTEMFMFDFSVIVFISFIGGFE